MLLDLHFLLTLGGDFHEVNTAIEKLDLRDNLFEAFQNNSLCNLITRSHLVYLDLSYCGLEGMLYLHYTEFPFVREFRYHSSNLQVRVESYSFSLMSASLITFFGSSIIRTSAFQKPQKSQPP
jgi:hypothetical protein